MTQKSNTTENENNVNDGKARFAEYQARVKKNKLTARIIFAATVTAAAVLAVKYVSITVPEWADDSEDV